MKAVDIEIPIGKRTPKYRFFEMLPAMLTFGFILLPIALSLIDPLLAAVFIVGYIIMWFVKAIGIAYRTIQGYTTLEKAKKVNWQGRLDDLEDAKSAALKYTDNQKGWGVKRHYKNLLNVGNNQSNHPKPSEILNAVIIATYNESIDILEPTIKAVLEGSYDPKKFILLIAYEERGGESTEKTVKHLISKYGNQCHYASAIMHPKDIPNEVTGKGGNITYTGRRLKEYIEKHGISPENVLVTTLDADNRPHDTYFSYVTYEYIVSTERNFRAFQPIALFLNNIWDAPAPMRVLATGNSFWTIINSMRPHMLRNFASHSQGLESLINTDFWSVRTIVEDGHQYWRSYFAFRGKYEAIPIYVPIYQDAVLAETYMKTIKAQFIQLRRWAYGVSDVAYVANLGFGKNRQVPFFGFIARFARLLDSHVSWAAAPIIITFGAWGPLLINAESSRSIIAHELPQVASNLQRVAMFGLIITVFLAFKMLPPRPARYKRHRNIFMLAQWLLMPITSIGYGSSAAFYSQLRLFFGKYLDRFDVTEKAVKK